MHELPFLIRHGGLVWKTLVVVAALVTALRAVQRARGPKWRGERHRSLKAHVLWGAFATGLAVLGTLVALWATGAIAMAVAPSENRMRASESIQIDAAGALAIAAAMPGSRPQALTRLERGVGDNTHRDRRTLELRVEVDDLVGRCERGLRRLFFAGLFEEVIARASACERDGRTWRARAQLGLGRPCEAFATLQDTTAAAPDPDETWWVAEVETRLVAAIGCGEWDAAAASARTRSILRDRTGGGRTAACLAFALDARNRDAAALEALQAASAENATCLALYVELAPADVAISRLRDWFAANPEPWAYDERPAWLWSRDAIAQVTLRLAPELVAQMQSIGVLDPAQNRSQCGAELADTYVRYTTAAWADAGLEVSDAHLGPGLRLALMEGAGIAELIGGDTTAFRARVDAMRMLGDTTTEDDADVHRRGSPRQRAQRLEQLWGFRQGTSGSSDELSLSDAVARLRDGRPREPHDDLFDPEVSDSLASGSVTRLAESLRTHEARNDCAIMAIAPRLTGDRSPLVDHVNSTELRLADPLPLTFATIAADRRDTQHLLGADADAARWDDLAVRNLALARSPARTLYYSVLGTILREL